MKKLFLILLVAFATLPLSAQQYVWNAPVGQDTKAKPAAGKQIKQETAPQAQRPSMVRSFAEDAGQLSQGRGQAASKGGNPTTWDLPVVWPGYSVQSAKRIYFENFENTDSTVIWPAGWSAQHTPGDDPASGAWSRIPVENKNGKITGTSGAYYANIIASNDYTHDAWLFSSGIALTKGKNYKVSFWVLADGTREGEDGGVENLKVTIGTQPDSAFMKKSGMELYDNNSETIAEWTKITKIFTANATGVHYIGFYAYSPIYGKLIAVDDVMLEELRDDDIAVESTHYPAIQTPISQNTLRARVINVGNNQQGNVKFKAIVNGASLETAPLASLPNNTTAEMEIPNAPLRIGQNSITYTVSADQTDNDLSDNMLSYSLNGSYNVLAADETTDYNTEGVGTNWPLSMYGQVFTINKKEPLSGIAVGLGITHVEAPETQFEVHVYKINDFDFSIDRSQSILKIPATRTRQTGLQIYKPATPVSLEPGNYYVAVQQKTVSMAAVASDNVEGRVLYANMYGHYLEPLADGYGALAIRLIMESQATCVAPANLKVVPSRNSAAFSWTGDEHSINYEISISLGTYTQTFSLPKTSITVTGLPELTTFSWKVRALCDADKNATASGGTFTTLPCQITTFPWTEGFESGIEGCWKRADGSNPKTVWHLRDKAVSQHPSGPHSGNLYAAFRIMDAKYGESGPYPHKQKLITPSLKLAGVTRPVLRFWHAQEKYETSQDVLKVYYRTSASGAWTLLATYADDLKDWQEETIELPGKTDDYYIAFEALSYDALGVALDDISVQPTYGNDVAVYAIPKPISKGLLTNQEPVSVVVKNIGSNAITGLNLKLTVDGAVVATEPLSGINIPNLGTHTYTFTTKANFSAKGAHTITVEAILPGDEDTSNNTLSKTIENYGNVAIMGIDTEIRACDIIFKDEGLDANYPIQDTHAEQILTFTPPQANDRVAVTFDNLGLNTELRDADKKLICPGDTLYVYNGAAIPANLMATLTGDLKAPLTFRGENTAGILTFKFSKNYTFYALAAGWKATVTCYTPPAHDAVLTSIAAPPVDILTASEPVTVTLKNRGFQTITNLPVVCKTKCATYSGTIPSLAPFESATHTFTVDMSLPGSYTVRAYADVPGDGDRSSDTLSAFTQCLSSGNMTVWDFEGQTTVPDDMLLVMPNGPEEIDMNTTSAYEEFLGTEGQPWIIVKDKTKPNNQAIASCSWYNSGRRDPNNWLILPKTGGFTVATGSKLSWMARSFESASSTNTPLAGYSVKLSKGAQAGNLAEYKTVLYTTKDEDRSWTYHEVDLTDYAEETVFIAFHNDAVGSILFIDDIKMQMPDAKVCSGANYTFTPELPAGMSFAWSRPGVKGLNDSIPASGTGAISERLDNTTISSKMVTYSCSYTQNGCAQVAELPVLILPPPVLISSLTPPPACNSAPYTYTPATNIPISYRWSRAAVPEVNGGDSASGTGVISEVLTATAGAPATVTYTFSLGEGICGNTQEVKVVVGFSPAAPSASVTAGSLTFCAGRSATVTAMSDAADNSYLWLRNNVAATVTSSAYSITQPGTYSVKAVNSYGCESVAAPVGEVKVLPAPMPITMLQTDYIFCEGGYAVISFTGFAGDTYQWYKNGELIPAASSSSYAAFEAGTYTVRTVNSNNCESEMSNEAIVSLRESITPTLTGVASICRNSVGIYTTQPNMSSYTWNIGGTANVDYQVIGSATENVIRIKWLTLGAKTLSVYYKAAGNCSGTSDAHTITVNPAPTPSIASGAVSLCMNGVGTYTTQAGMSSYIWSISGTQNVDYEVLGSMIDHIIQIKWLTQGAKVLGVSYANSGKCAVISADYGVSVAPFGTALISSSDAVVCAGATGTYATEAGMRNYKWTIGGVKNVDYTIIGSSSGHILQIEWLASGAKSLSVAYESDGGCGAVSDGYTVKVTDASLVIVSDLQHAAVCSGASHLFGVEAAGANLSYQWFYNGHAIEGATQSTYRIANAATTNSGRYHVVITNECNKSVQSQTAELTINLEEEKIISYKWDDVPMINCNPATNGGHVFTSFQWYRNGKPVPHATQPFIQIPKEDIGTAKYACSMGLPDGGSLSTCEFSASLSSSHTLAVYPNPVAKGHHLKVQLSGGQKSAQGALFNINGDRVKSAIAINAPEGAVDTNGLLPGAYILQVTNADGSVESVKFIVK